MIYYSELEKVIKRRNIKALVQSGIVNKIDIDGNVLSRYAFKEIEYSGDIEGKEHIEILPKGKYLTSVYTKETEKECMAEIKRYMEENNLKAKMYIDVDLIDEIFHTESYTCQIQILLEE